MLSYIRQYSTFQLNMEKHLASNRKITPVRKRPFYQASYSSADVELALEELSQGEMSLGKIAQKYGIPKSTLSDKNLGKSPVSTKFGRPPIIPEQVEQDLVR